jgi:hypothetical protein
MPPVPIVGQTHAHKPFISSFSLSLSFASRTSIRATMPTFILISSLTKFHLFFCLSSAFSSDPSEIPILYTLSIPLSSYSSITYFLLLALSFGQIIPNTTYLPFPARVSQFLISSASVFLGLHTLDPFSPSFFRRGNSLSF